MSLGLLLVFVHIALMFAGVVISYGPTLLFLLALRSGRTESLRSVGVAVAPAVRLIPAVYILAAIAGVAAALVNQYSLLAPWLVISYVIFIVLTVIGAAIAGPRLQRVGEMVGPMPDGPIPPEVRAVATGGGFLWIELFDFVALFAVIFVMVVKPFS